MGTSKVTYNPPKYAGFMARSSMNDRAMKQSARKEPRGGSRNDKMMSKM